MPTKQTKVITFKNFYLILIIFKKISHMSLR